MGFPSDFLWGTATAAYQIEGAANEDGRGSSVWDDFCKRSGATFQGHSGDVACNHYHRFEQDVALMAELGIRNYRFSVSWPRVLPNGDGAVNAKGLGFYDRLVDCLLAHNIRPFLTLYHWDLPSALFRRGGWLNPESISWFEAYAEVVGRALGDRVKDIATFNEPQCFIGGGLLEGFHAPGLRLGDAQCIPAAHNVLMAHGSAARKLREVVPGLRLGWAPCAQPKSPATESAADIEAARKAYFQIDSSPSNWCFSPSWWSDPVMLGCYPEDGLSAFGQYLPKGFEKDLPLIHEKPALFGQNIYDGRIVRATENGGFELLPLPVGQPRTANEWPVTPEALRWGPRFLWERYHTPILITENGLSTTDWVSVDGKVHDPNRIDFMARYLPQLRLAMDDGAEIAGYFAWSLLDNFEWARGYSDRFGLVHVDYQTQERIPKDSAYWYRDLIRSNGALLD